MKDQSNGTTVYVEGSLTVQNRLYLVPNKLMGMFVLVSLKWW